MTTGNQLVINNYPQVSDSDSYQLSTRDFEFLGIDSTAASVCAARQCPLGIALDDFRHFITMLYQALDDDQMSDADVRIQGSSTTFFSSSMKKYPREKVDRDKLFLEENGRLPLLSENDQIEAKHNSIWGKEGPIQRPFDSMFVLGISPEKSDIDVQISSDMAFARARKIARSRGLSEEGMRFDHPTYNFLIKQISDLEFLYLHRWSSHWQNKLDRGVNIAIFESEGPPEQTNGLSSHFQKTDWILSKGGVTDA